MKYMTNNITINDIRYKGVNSVSIEKSIHNIVGKATIKLPTSAVLQAKNEQTVIETAEQISRGDKVVIKLGYDDNNKKEFEGYVKNILHKTPLVVECVDYIYELQEKNIKKTYSDTKLLTVLQDIVADTNITLDDDIPDLSINRLILATDKGESVPRAKALTKIKDQLGIAVYFRGSVLYAGLLYGKDAGDVNYSLGYNTKDAGDDLKYKSAEEVKIKLKAINISDDGTKTEVEVGDSDGSLRTVYYTDITTEAELRTLAENEIDNYRYDGYEGKYKAFLQPYCEPAMSAEIEDIRFPDREGTYYVDSVKVEYGQSGGSRTIEISKKLSS
jgi:hypothetical protein